MRKYFISILFILCVLGIYSQNYSFKVEDDIAACFYKKKSSGIFYRQSSINKNA